MNNICPFLWSWLLLMYITISAYFPTITCDTLASAPFCSQQYANIQLWSAIHLQLSRLHQVFEERRRFNSLGNCKLDLLLIDGLWNVCHLLRSGLHNCTKIAANDGRVNAVTGISELRVLPLFKNLPSFDLIRSFQHRSWMTKLIGMKWKWPEWLLNDIYPL